LPNAVDREPGTIRLRAFLQIVPNARFKMDRWEHQQCRALRARCSFREFQLGGVAAVIVTIPKFILKTPHLLGRCANYFATSTASLTAAGVFGKYRNQGVASAFDVPRLGYATHQGENTFIPSAEAFAHIPSPWYLRSPPRGSARSVRVCWRFSPRAFTIRESIIILLEYSETRWRIVSNSVL
jgi:hypothetical protein